jgi:hypothetical protein
VSTGQKPQSAKAAVVDELVQVTIVAIALIPDVKRPGFSVILKIWSHCAPYAAAPLTPWQLNVLPENCVLASQLKP